MTKEERKKLTAMNVAIRELDAELKAGTTRPVYLFYGEEEYLKHSFKSRIRRSVVPDENSMNVTSFIENQCSADAIISQADTMPFFADKRIVLIEESGFFGKRKKKKDDDGDEEPKARSREEAEARKLAEYLPSLPPETVLLFYEREADSRGKLYKEIEKTGMAVEFVHPDEKTLVTWILRRLTAAHRTIRSSTMEQLLMVTGDDMEHIANELEKLISYTEEREEITAEDIRLLCAPQLEHIVFQMIDAMAAGDQKTTFDIYYELLSQKEAPMKILSLLVRQFNQMYQVRLLRDEGFRSDRIAEKMRLQSFVVSRLLDAASRYETRELRKALEDCADLETRVKTGRIADTIAVEMVLVKYSTK